MGKYKISPVFTMGVFVSLVEKTTGDFFMKKDNEQKRTTGLGITQFQVIIRNDNEWGTIFNLLTEQNYTAIGLSKDTPPTKPNAICIDEKEHAFFQTSVTCLACACSINITPITVEEFLRCKTISIKP